MTETYKEYLDERLNVKRDYTHQRDTYRLAAVSGDMSARGLGSCASIKNVDKDDFELVDRYVTIQDELEEWQRFHLLDMINNTASDEVKEQFIYLDELKKKMYTDMGMYFTSKYDYRSHWAWLETPEV